MTAGYFDVAPVDAPIVWDGRGRELVGAAHTAAETLAHLPAHDHTEPRWMRQHAAIEIGTRVRDGDLTEIHALDALAPYAAMDEDERADRLGILLAALDHERNVEDRSIPLEGPSWDAMAVDAESAVLAAADKLIGDA